MRGLERLVPGKTYVFVANHQSIYDIPMPVLVDAVSAAHHRQGIARQLSDAGLHLKRTGHMLVDRKQPDRAGIFGWASRLTSNGLSLIVFPEGTRSRDGMRGQVQGRQHHAGDAGRPAARADLGRRQPPRDEEGRADDEAGARAR